MSQQVEEVSSSRPLFDTNAFSQSDESTDLKADTYKIPKVTSTIDHKSHWLFSGEQESSEEEPIAIDAKPVISTASIHAAFQRYCTEVQVVQGSLPISEWPKPVQEDKCGLVMDDIKFLFRNDCIKYHRNMDTECFQTVQRKKKIMMGLTGYSAHNNAINIFATRQQPTRKVRTRQKYNYIEDKDDEDSDDFEKKKNKSFLPSKRPVIKPATSNHPRDILHKQNSIAGCSQKENENDSQSHHSKNETRIEHDSLSFMSDVDVSDGDDVKETAYKKTKTEVNIEKPSFTNQVKNTVSSLTSYFKSDKKMNKIVKQKASENDDESIIVQKQVIEVFDLENADNDDDPPPVLKRTKIESPKDRPKVQCPMCNVYFNVNEVETHAYNCQGPSTISTRSQRSQDKSEEKPFDQQAWSVAFEGLNEGSEFKKTKAKVTHESEEFQEAVKMRDYTKLRGNKPYSTVSPHVTSGAFPHSPKSNRRKITSQEPLKEPGRKPTAINRAKRGYSVVLNGSEDDEDIFKGYNTTKKKQIVTYSARPKPKSSYFNDSQDNHTYKCAKCDQVMSEEGYKSHTQVCLEDSTIRFSDEP